jgi:hypothetical protein
MENHSQKHARLYFGITRLQHLVHLLILIISLVLISEPKILESTYLGVKFWKALGEAGLIALFVIYLVEAQSHKRLEETAVKMISQVGRGIFGLVYGHELPEKIVKTLEESTLKQPIYRDRMFLNYELTAKNFEVKGQDVKLCELASSHSFKLINCSDKMQPIPVTVYLERDKWLTTQSGVGAADTEPTIYYVQIGSKIYYDPSKLELIEKIRGTIDTSMIKEDISKYVKQTDEGNKLTFCVTHVEIPAHGTLDVSYSGLLHKRYSDNEFWTTKYPTQGVSLSITTNDYEVNVDFPDSPEPTKETSGKMTQKWEYDDVMLKGHSVVFWWYPKAEV